MRIKVFTAPTVDRAMQRVRAELGEDAIILGVETPAGAPVRVTAGLDDDVGHDAPADDGPYDDGPYDDGPDGAGEAFPWTEAGCVAAAPATTPAPEDADAVLAEIRHALSFHGVPRPIATRLAATAEQVAAEAPSLALAGALQATFRYAPLRASAAADDRPMLLIGPPGAGKTLAVAKLTLRAHRAGRTVQVISTDRRRAGGVEELAALTRILGVELVAADDDTAVAAAVAAAAGPVFIDTAGTNPFDAHDLAMLAESIDAADAEPLLVLAAGGDPMESVDIAAAYATLGVRRLFVSKLDLARRLGGLLAAVDAAAAAFSEASVSYQVADGLRPLNAVALARLLLPHAAEIPETPLLQEALS